MRLAVLLLVAIAATRLDDPQDVIRAETARHQGSWVAIAMEREGMRTPEVIVTSITRTVEGDHVVWKREGKSFAGTTVKLDPATNPGSIDVTPDGGPNRDKPVLGIYKLEGDTLTICMADPKDPRPKEFSAPKGSKRTLMSLRRVEAPPKGRKKS